MHDVALFSECEAGPLMVTGFWKNELRTEDGCLMVLGGRNWVLFCTVKNQLFPLKSPAYAAIDVFGDMAVGF